MLSHRSTIPSLKLDLLTLEMLVVDLELLQEDTEQQEPFPSLVEIVLHSLPVGLRMYFRGCLRTGGEAVREKLAVSTAHIWVVCCDGAVLLATPVHCVAYTRTMTALI